MDRTLKVVNVEDLSDEERKELGSTIPNIKLMEEKIDFFVGTHKLTAARGAIPCTAADSFRSKLNLLGRGLNWLPLQVHREPVAEFLWVIVKTMCPDPKPFANAQAIAQKMSISQVSDNFAKITTLVFLPSEDMSKEGQDFLSVFVLAAGLPGLNDTLEMIQLLPGSFARGALNAKNIELLETAVNRMAEAIGQPTIKLETIENLQAQATASSETSSPSSSISTPPAEDSD